MIYNFYNFIKFYYITYPYSLVFFSIKQAYLYILYKLYIFIFMYNNFEINLFGLSQSQILKYQSEFQKDINTSKSVSIKICNKQIYAKAISESKLQSKKLCESLCKKRIKNIQLNNQQFLNYPKQYIKELFDKFLFYITEGYIQYNESFRMDLIYICMMTDVTSLLSKLILIKVSNESTYNKMWNIIICMINNELQWKFDMLSKLVMINSQFLLDYYKPEKISVRYLQIKSKKHVCIFLKWLFNLLIQNNNNNEHKEKYKRLVQILLKYYISQNNSDKNQFQPCSQIIFQQNGQREEQINYQQQNQSLIEQIAQKEQQIIKKNQQQEMQLRKTIKSYENKVKEKKQQMIQDDGKKQPKTIFKQLKNSNNNFKKQQKQIKQKKEIIEPKQTKKIDGNKSTLIHHPDISYYCKCSQGIQLSCGHLNCKQCGLYRIASMNNRIMNSNQNIQKYKIRCLMHNIKSGSCQQIWTQDVFQKIKNINQ